MDRRIIFLSDLHLGRGGVIEDFKADEMLEELLVSLRPADDGTARLVLLGDTFDLWQAVTEEECQERLGAKIALAYDVDTEVAKLRAIAQSHPRVFEGLSRFLAADRCFVTVVPGNHDHSLVNEQVAEEVRRLLSCSDERLAVRSSFDEFGIYAEHGNQYGSSNSYPDFNAFDWRQDCPGYYFVRLFWNRVEFLEPGIEDGPSIWRNAFRRFLRNPRRFGRHFALALRYFYQYWRDPRVPVRLRASSTAVVAPGGEASRIAPEDMPDLLMGGRVEGASAFSSDPYLEEMYRRAYAESEEVRAAVGEILADQRRLVATSIAAPDGSVLEPSPTPRRGPEFAAWHAEDDCDSAAEVFNVHNPRRLSPHLNRAAYRYVLFGHTHVAKDKPLDSAIRYFNCGSWASRGERMPYVELTVAGGVVRHAELHRFAPEGGPGPRIATLSAPPASALPARAGELRAGDVLLYDGGTSFISRAIKLLDRADVSHAGLFLDREQPSVGEAIACGLVSQPLEASVAGAERVWVHRLSAPIVGLEPVLARAEHYLARGGRYGFEQILVLAIVCLTRRLPLPRVIQPFVEAVLRKASSLLIELASGPREPMICSELVFRSFEEAEAGPSNPYRIVIEGLRPGQRLLSGDGAGLPKGRGVEEGSILAALNSPAGREAAWSTRSLSLVDVAHAPAADAEKAWLAFEACLGTEAAAAPFDLGTLAPVVQGLAASWRLARAGGRGSAREALGPRAQGDVDLAILRDDLADFVTPGDLRRTQSLHQAFQLK